MALSKFFSASLLGVATLTSGALAQGGGGSAKAAFCKKFPDTRTCLEDPHSGAVAAPPPTSGTLSLGQLQWLQIGTH